MDLSLLECNDITQCVLKERERAVGNFDKIIDMYNIFRDRHVIPVVPNNDCKNFLPKKVNAVPTNDKPLDVTRDVWGSSLAGVSTSLVVPKLDITLDAGRTVTELPVTSNYFLSHFDEDHVGGLPAIMCSSIGHAKPIKIFMPSDPNDKITSLMDAIKHENPDVNVEVITVSAGKSVPMSEDMHLEFFNVKHNPESIGVSVMKKNGISFENILTYTGDTLLDNEVMSDPHFDSTRNIIVESTVSGVFSTIKGMERDQEVVGHASMKDVATLTSKSTRVKNVLLTHFLPTLCIDIKNDANKTLFPVHVKKGTKFGYIPSCSTILNNPAEIKQSRNLF